MHDIFLSYSSKDRARLKTLVDALEHNNWSVFWDHRSIKVSEKWHEIINTEVHESRCVIVVWSQAALESSWVMGEAIIALERNVIFPINIDGVELPVGFNTIHTADLAGKKDPVDHPSFEALMTQLASHLGTSKQPPKPLPKQAFLSKKIVIAMTSIVMGLGLYQYFKVSQPDTPLQTNQFLASGLPFLEPKMIAVSGRTYLTGCDPKRDSAEFECDRDEKPAHEVTVKDFKISATEVTNSQFVAFLNAEGRSPHYNEPWIDINAEDTSSNIVASNNNFSVELGFEHYPAGNISWYGAKAYSAWLSKVMGKPYRLPTDAEWEFAARGGEYKMAYPWGNNIGKNNANCYGVLCGDSFEDSSPVGSFPANGFGLYDMHGNVWEWTEDCWYDGYDVQPVVNGECSRRSLRGGSWLDPPADLRSAGRGRIDPTNRNERIGVRVVFSVD